MGEATEFERVSKPQSERGKNVNAHLQDHVQPNDSHECTQTRLVSRRLVQNLVFCQEVVVNFQRFGHIAILEMNDGRFSKQGRRLFVPTVY